jgi:hypothetical protein
LPTRWHQVVPTAIESTRRRQAAWILLAVDPGCAYRISAQQRSAAVLGLFKPVEQAAGTEADTLVGIAIGSQPQ